MVCGDKILEGDEVCDDGNNLDGDGCSGNCKSNETCGNKLVDAIDDEECDDGNHLDHDGCSSACKLETPHWIRHTLVPTERVFPASAYDSRRDRIVVFGGQDSTSTPLADTLEWNGADWIVTDPVASPTPRTEAAMAYDREHGLTVLFGGTVPLGGAALGDTWLWDGVAWTSPNITNAPSPRFGMAMAYDPRRQRRRVVRRHQRRAVGQRDVQRHVGVERHARGRRTRRRRTRARASSRRWPTIRSSARWCSPAATT